jgi:hypothetical protein
MHDGASDPDDPVPVTFQVRYNCCSCEKKKSFNVRPKGKKSVLAAAISKTTCAIVRHFRLEKDVLIITFLIVGLTLPMLKYTYT